MKRRKNRNRKMNTDSILSTSFVGTLGEIAIIVISGCPKFNIACTFLCIKRCLINLRNFRLFNYLKQLRGIQTTSSGINC